MVNSDIYISVRKVKKTEDFLRILKKTIFAYLIAVISFYVSGTTVYTLMKKDPLLFSLVPKEEFYSSKKCEFNEYGKCTVHREKLSAMGLAIFYHFIPKLIGFLFTVGLSGTLLTIVFYNLTKKYYWRIMIDR